MGMSRAEEYYSNFGKWNIEDYVTNHILNNSEEIQRFNAVVEEIPEDGYTLLDIGCGPGVFLHLLHKQTGIKGIGIEITDIKIRYAQESLSVTVLKGGASHLPFKDGSFDIVTALELMEHLPYEVYEKALEEVQRVARKWIIISVPYREERRYVPCPYCGTKFQANYHLRSFDESRLQRLFPRFEILKLKKMLAYSQSPQLFKKVFHLFFEEPYPEFAVCPACGFRRDPLGGIGSKKRRFEWARGFSRLMWALCPKKKQYRWIIALYARKTS
ncbi:MAG: class I SAM-dependent methyltransferase [Thermodesulfobacteriota bacterium]